MDQMISSQSQEEREQRSGAIRATNQLGGAHERAILRAAEGADEELFIVESRFLFSAYNTGFLWASEGSPGFGNLLEGSHRAFWGRFSSWCHCDCASYLLHGYAENVLLV